MFVDEQEHNEAPLAENATITAQKHEAFSTTVTGNGKDFETIEVDGYIFTMMRDPAQAQEIPRLEADTDPRGTGESSRQQSPSPSLQAVELNSLRRAERMNKTPLAKGKGVLTSASAQSDDPTSGMVVTKPKRKRIRSSRYSFDDSAELSDDPDLRDISPAISDDEWTPEKFGEVDTVSSDDEEELEEKRRQSRKMQPLVAMTTTANRCALPLHKQQVALLQHKRAKKSAQCEQNFQMYCKRFVNVYHSNQQQSQMTGPAGPYSSAASRETAFSSSTSIKESMKNPSHPDTSTTGHTQTEESTVSIQHTETSSEGQVRSGNNGHVVSNKVQLSLMAAPSDADEGINRACEEGALKQGAVKVKKEWSSSQQNVKMEDDKLVLQQTLQETRLPDCQEDAADEGQQTKRPRRFSRKHTPDELTCPTCGKQFANIYRLRRHVFSHGDLRPYSCDVCGKAF
jgi:hypothetical protein